MHSHSRRLPNEDLELHPEQIKAFRRMTGGQKLAVFAQLYHGARSLSAAHLKQKHPEWTDEQVESEVRRIFMHARD